MIREQPRLKSIRLKPGTRHKEDPDSKLTATKFGGIPYWPKGMKYPTSKLGTMFLLAQLNFNDLPKIPNYPSSGILQFFIPDDRDNGWSPRTCAVIYHERISKDVEDIPIQRTTLSPKLRTFPFIDNGVWYPRAYIEESVLNPEVGGFHNEFTKRLKNATGQKIDFWDVCREVWDYYEKKYPKWYGSRVGGYPFFTQYDPRGEYKEQDPAEPNILLLQMDTEDGVVWGDHGVCNFFVTQNGLKRRDFSKKNILYYWDCC